MLIMKSWEDSQKLWDKKPEKMKDKKLPVYQKYQKTKYTIIKKGLYEIKIPV